jgi:hypothetical protein
MDLADKILIYTTDITPRLQYIIRLVFTELMGLEPSLTSDARFFLDSGLPKLNYSANRMDEEPFLKASDLLFLKGTELPYIVPVKSGAITGFFPASDDSILPFDALASSFFVVSRMEEYKPGNRDRHGRYLGSLSELNRHGLIDKPVVHLWARELYGALREFYPLQGFRSRDFRNMTTIDIDNAWAYRNKGLMRSVASLARDLFTGSFVRVLDRFKVLSGKMRDPYDTYDYLFSQLRGREKDVMFFFLMGDQSAYDRAVSWKDREFNSLVRKIAGNFRIGIHPSYLSSEPEKERLVTVEKERLQSISGSLVKASRQHYLRLDLPETYRNLIASGLQEDYSMGFHDLAGFRAGMCVPYQFYDLLNERETALRICPFQVMDVTLRNYMKLSPEEAIIRAKALIDQVRSVGGTFISVWHNESVSGRGEWKDYLRVFEYMNQAGIENEQH